MTVWILLLVLSAPGTSQSSSMKVQFATRSACEAFRADVTGQWRRSGPDTPQAYGICVEAAP